MAIPENFDVTKDGFIKIEMRSIPDGHTEVERNCIGTDQNLVVMVICAMAKQPELREVLTKAVEIYWANPGVINFLKKKLNKYRNQ